MPYWKKRSRNARDEIKTGYLRENGRYVRENGRYVEKTRSLRAMQKRMNQLMPVVDACVTAGGIKMGVRPAVLTKYYADVRFRWTAAGHRSSNNAWAYPSKREVAFNPFAIAEYLDHLTEEQFDARVTDLILHELGHLFAWRFMKARGHGKVWRAWGRAMMYVPIGCTHQKKKLRLAVANHPKRLERAGYAAASTNTPKKENTMSSATQEEYTVVGLEGLKVAEIREIADEMGVETIDARRQANGATPNKSHWIDAIIEKQESGGEDPVEDEPEEGGDDAEKPAGRIWRLAEVTNPKSGRTTWLRCRAGGYLFDSEAKRTGGAITRLEEWWEVRAGTKLTEVKAKIEAGEATPMNIEKYEAQQEESED